MIPANDTIWRKWMWYLYAGNYLHDENAYYCGAFPLSRYAAYWTGSGRVMPDFRNNIDDGSSTGIYGVECSIGYSEWIGGWGSLGKSLSTLVEPTNTPVFMDSWFYRVADPTSTAACYAPLAPRHMRNTQVSVVYVDGHAKFENAIDFINHPYF
jgi:hypothetical protein